MLIFCIKLLCSGPEISDCNFGQQKLRSAQLCFEIDGRAIEKTAAGFLRGVIILV
jgi:hypothetical protein